MSTSTDATIARRRAALAARDTDRKQAIVIIADTQARAAILAPTKERDTDRGALISWRRLFTSHR